MSRSAGGRSRSFDLHQALDTAVKIFWEYGYHGATLERLTQAMGINKPSLFLAFGNKQALFRQALAHYRTHYLSDAFAQLEYAGSTYEAFQRFFDQLTQLFTSTDTPRGCLVNLTLVTGCPDEEAQTDLQMFSQTNLDAITQRLKQAQQQGELSASESIGDLALFFAAMTQTLATAARAGQDFHQVRSIAHTALRLLPD